jgi:hypothetical protein
MTHSRKRNLPATRFRTEMIRLVAGVSALATVLLLLSIHGHV